MLHELVKRVLDNEHGRNLLTTLHENIWAETPRDPNNTNEYILIAGKRTLLRDIEILLNQKQEK